MSRTAGACFLERLLLLALLITTAAPVWAGAPDRFQKQAESEWKNVLDAVGQKPKEYKQNIARLRDFLAIYEEFDVAAVAKKKLEATEQAWETEARQTFEQVKAEVDKAVEKNDYSALRKLEEIPAGLRSADLDRKIDEEKKKHTEKVIAAFAGAREKARESVKNGRPQDALAGLRRFEGVPIGRIGEEAKALIESITRAQSVQTATAYTPVAARVLSMAGQRQYDEARKTIEQHLQANPAPEVPGPIRQDRDMIERLQIVWQAYEKAVAGLKPGEKIALRDFLGSPPRAGTVVSVKDRTLALRIGDGPVASVCEFDMRLLPSTEVVRLARDRVLKDPSPAALGGCAAMLCIDDFTPPDDGLKLAREYIEAAKKAGEPIEYYSDILSQKAAQPKETTAEYILRGARVLYQAGQWQSCRARCIALKAKFASSLVMAESGNEVDKMLEESLRAPNPHPQF